MSHAAEAAGVGRTSVYDWQEHDERFAFEFRQAEIRATEVLEQEARRRAVDGVVSETPVIRNGEVVYTITETKYSDTLLIFLLKARAPEKYRERHDITSGGRPLQASHEDLDAAIERQLAQLVARGQGEDAMEAAGATEAADA